MSAEGKVKKIIMEQLDVSADSLDLTELIMAMEEAFKIEIADDDAQKIHRVQDVVDYVKAHITE